MQILNARLVGKQRANAVYCGRPSVYGNPFFMKNESMRAQVCDQYREWIYQPAQAWLRAKMKEDLIGKDLICWCAPARCHCETIREIVESKEI